MSRKRTSSSAGKSSSARGNQATQGVAFAPEAGGAMVFVTGVLLAARYFLPAESAALGETLWIVQFWLIAAVGWLWLAARTGESLRRWDALDVGLGLMIGGHVLAAVLVLMSEGDKRAALNMLWEWIGVGVASLMIREVVTRPADRERLLSVIVISAITLSALGIWQHHVWYPSISEKLTEFDRLSRLEPDDRDEAVERETTLRLLRRELGALAQANDPTEQALLRSRVQSSTEPIGRFALANTFAGLLLAGLMLALAACMAGMVNDRGNWRWWAGAVLVVATAYCFWLTKSRTASVGLLAGLLIWGMLEWRRGGATRGIKWGAAIVGLILLGLPIIASLSGGLDREVITEAPKSLQYRLEYWTATGAVIREQPVFGVGPGNFRQAYLHHKLPGSSEEVLDPHNLFLDVWANGGLLAMAGLIIVIAVVLWRTLQRWPAVDSSGSPSTDDANIGGAAMSGASHQPHSFAGVSLRLISWRLGVGVLAIGLAALIELLNGSGFSMGGWWMIAAWALVSIIWPRMTPRLISSAVFAAAALGLVVHLMGAGGIGMPAILQTFVLLAACLMESDTAAVSSPGTRKSFEALPEPLPWRSMAGAATCLCLAIACAFTATVPVSTSRTQMQLGRAILAEGGQPHLAMRRFESAIEADPLAGEPWQELAIAHLVDWGRMARADENAFESAVRAQTEAIRHDPLSPGGWQLLGDMWWQRFQSRSHPEFAAEALVAYRKAVECYPNLASLQAKLAESADAAGKPDAAFQAAGHAVELDDANRSYGHTDKYLSALMRQKMELILRRQKAGL